MYVFSDLFIIHLQQGVANFLYEKPGGKHLRFCGPQEVSVVIVFTDFVAVSGHGYVSVELYSHIT